MVAVRQRPIHEMKFYATLGNYGILPDKQSGVQKFAPSRPTEASEAEGTDSGRQGLFVSHITREYHFSLSPMPRVYCGRRTALDGMA